MFLFLAEHQAGKVYIPLSMVVGSTRRRIESDYTLSVADALPLLFGSYRFNA